MMYVHSAACLEAQSECEFSDYVDSIYLDDLAYQDMSFAALLAMTFAVLLGFVFLV